jgi:hypothetical protein
MPASGLGQRTVLKAMEPFLFTNRRIDMIFFRTDIFPNSFDDNRQLGVKEFTKR